MSSVEERLNVIEARLDRLRVPPVRDELLQLRDAHGLRLAAIEARLTSIETEVSETTSWIERRLTDIDVALERILDRLQ